MPDIGERISAARGLVNGPRTRARFNQLFELVAGAHELEPGQREMLLSYARAGLEAWPASTRRLPKAAMVELINGRASQLSDALTLCASICLDEHLFKEADRTSYRPQGDMCDVFLLTPELGGVREVIMERAKPFTEQLERRGLFSAAVFAPRLERLDAYQRLDPRWLSLPMLRELKLIMLSGYPLERWVEFIHAERAGLRSLSISRMSRGEAMLGYLVGASWWPGLEELGLRGNRLGVEVFKKVLWGKKVFKGLDLGVNSFQMSGALEGLGGMELVHLERLGLSSLRFDSVGVSALGRLGFESLRALDLSFNQLGQAGVQAIGRGKWAKTLTELDVSSCGLWDCGDWEALGELGQLEALSLRDNELGIQGAQRLVGCGVLRGIKRLDLARNKLNLDALLHIMDALGGPSLRELNVGANSLSEAELTKLLDHPNLRELERIQVSDLSPHSLRMESWQAQLPGCALELGAH